MYTRTLWEAKEKFTPDLCRANEGRLLERLRSALEETSSSAPNSRLTDSCASLPLTHTCEKSDFSAIMEGTLGNSPGLLSVADTKGHWANEEPLWTAGVELGLHRYVSAYVGIHDPVAAEVGRPVGVFITGESEPPDPRTAHFCFRDLRSNCKFFDGVPVSQLPVADRQGLLFSVARMPEILAHDVVRKHGGREWIYWGDPEEKRFRQASASTRGGSTFYWKLVFHRYRTIPLERFQAVLYPSRLDTFNPVNGRHEPEHLNDGLVPIIRKVLGRDRLLIYEYEGCVIEHFIEASRAVARFMKKYGTVPPSVAAALQMG